MVILILRCSQPFLPLVCRCEASSTVDPASIFLHVSAMASSDRAFPGLHEAAWPNSCRSPAESVSDRHVKTEQKRLFALEIITYKIINYLKSRRDTLTWGFHEYSVSRVAVGILKSRVWWLCWLLFNCCRVRCDSFESCSRRGGSFCGFCDCDGGVVQFLGYYIDFWERKESAVNVSYFALPLCALLERGRGSFSSERGTCTSLSIRGLKNMFLNDFTQVFTIMYVLCEARQLL